MTPATLPGEGPLLALAGRFVQAEQTIRELLARAPAGDRRRLLELALEILLDLRREVTRSAIGAAMFAYATAALATSVITGRPAPAAEAASNLGRGLQLGLDRAIVTAEKGSQRAFRTVTTDTLAEAERHALTARRDRLGRPYPLGAEGTMRTATVAGHASTRATVDTLGEGAQVTISAQGAPSCNMNNICQAFAGRTLTLGDSRTRLAPFHPSCSHRTFPAGVAEADYTTAQADAVGRLEAPPLAA